MIIEKNYKKINYLIYFPDGYDENLKYPLILDIQGAGSRGNNLELLKIGGPIYELTQGRKLPFIVVAPQCYVDTWFEIFEQLLEFIENLINKTFIDKKRVYLCGASMGGYTAWQMAMTKPNWFAALVPCCGGGMYWNAGRLKNVPIWAFHGALDNVVCVTESINMVKAVNNAGGNAKLTIYPDAAHNSWERAFSDDEMYKWLEKQALRGN